MTNEEVIEAFGFNTPLRIKSDRKSRNLIGYFQSVVMQTTHVVKNFA